MAPLDHLQKSFQFQTIVRNLATKVAHVVQRDFMHCPITATIDKLQMSPC